MSAARPSYRDAVPTETPAAMFIACWIAQAWPKSTPTVHQLRARYAMSRATAYRWIAALKAARGQLVEQPTTPRSTHVDR